MAYYSIVLYFVWLNTVKHEENVKREPPNAKLK